LWSRLHARQAAAFGFLMTAVVLVLFVVPFVLSIMNWSTGTIILIYTIALSIDGLFGLTFFALAIWYSIRAARGELFDIPIAAALGGKIFPIRRNQDVP
jgi:hypothetical protein